MRFKILQSFKFAHRGVDVTEYTQGDELEVEDVEFAEVAVREGWAKPVGEDAPKTKKKGKPAESED